MHIRLTALRSPRLGEIFSSMNPDIDTGVRWLVAFCRIHAKATEPDSPVNIGGLGVFPAWFRNYSGMLKA
jgi:hypothetical protein